MFEGIIGHKEQIKMLEKSLELGNISHAYLFTGSKGIGKCKVALEFARKILNVDNINSSPDFKYISKNEDKRDIIIEQIRKEIIDDIYIAPVASDRKVYIVDDAELLNVAAQNALLKTLEEPPRYVVIILIASNTNNFLTTILSRVNNIVFDNIEKDELKEYISKKNNISLSDNILDFFNGSIGVAEKFIQEGNIEKLKDIEKLYKCLLSKNEIKSLLVASEIDFNFNLNLEYLEYLLYSSGKYFCIKFVEKARNRLKNNGNYDIVIDNMLLKIIEHI